MMFKCSCDVPFILYYGNVLYYIIDLYNVMFCLNVLLMYSTIYFVLWKCSILHY